MVYIVVQSVRINQTSPLIVYTVMGYIGGLYCCLVSEDKSDVSSYCLYCDGIYWWSILLFSQ